jgi:hypothetical protein
VNYTRAMCDCWLPITMRICVIPQLGDCTVFDRGKKNWIAQPRLAPLGWRTAFALLIALTIGLAAALAFVG